MKTEIEARIAALEAELAAEKAKLAAWVEAVPAELHNAITRDIFDKIAAFFGYAPKP